MTDPSRPDDRPLNGTVAGAMLRDRLMALVLIICIVAMGALAGVCWFRPPQEWQLVNTVVSNLKDVILMVLSAHFALQQKHD